MQMNTRKTLYRVSFLAVCALMSFRILVLFLSQGINNYDRARYLEMVDGTAFRPFVTRALLPIAVRTITSSIPSSWRHALSEGCGQHPTVLKAFEKLGWEKSALVEYALGVGLMYTALLTALLALRWLCRGVYQSGEYLLDGAVLMELLVLLPLAGAGHIYDYPTLCLFTLGLGALARKRWPLYLIVFAVGCLNKETTILLTLVFAVHFSRTQRLPMPLFPGLLATQILVFILIRGGLAFVYWNNPGSVIELHLLDNLIRYREPVMASSVATLGGAGLLMAYRWKDKPAFLRSASLILLPLLILTLFFGMLGELRDYYEFVPIGVLLAVNSIAQIVGVEIRKSED